MQNYPLRTGVTLDVSTPDSSYSPITIVGSGPCGTDTNQTPTPMDTLFVRNGTNWKKGCKKLDDLIGDSRFLMYLWLGPQNNEYR